MVLWFDFNIAHGIAMFGRRIFWFVAFRGFDTSLEFLVPEAWSVLRSDTGYLGPSDLDEFDKVPRS